MSYANATRAAEFREREHRKAELELRAYNKEGFCYQDANILLHDTLQTLSRLPPLDVAWKTFHELASKYRHICNALSVLGDHQRKDHLEKVEVIWSYAKGKVVEEKTLYIPVGKTRNRDMELRIAGTAELLRAGVHHEHTLSLEVVVA